MPITAKEHLYEHTFIKNSPTYTTLWKTSHGHNPDGKARERELRRKLTEEARVMPNGEAKG